MADENPYQAPRPEPVTTRRDVEPALRAAAGAFFYFAALLCLNCAMGFAVAAILGVGNRFFFNSFICLVVAPGACFAGKASLNMADKQGSRRFAIASLLFQVPGPVLIVIDYLVTEGHASSFSG